MPTIEEAVDFLIKNNALELGESPWPTYNEDEDVYEVDWDRLFPPRGRNVGLEPDEGVFLANDDDLGALDDVLGSGPPEPRGDYESGCQLDWDICAWYQPIHFYGHNWGIFIKESCVRRAVLMIARFVPRSTKSAMPLRLWWKALNRAAIYLYFLHEHYHHKIECLGFRLHVVQRKSSFLPYHKLIYAGTKGSDAQLEEALANADSYHRLNVQPYASGLTGHVVKATRDFLKWQFPHDPPGYRMAVHYLNKPHFDAGENTLLAQVKEVTLTPAQPTEE